MKKTSFMKKSLMSLAAVAMMMGVVAPVMADEGHGDGDRDFRFRVERRVDVDGDATHSPFGFNKLGSFSGFPFFGGLSSFGLGNFSGFGFDNTINSMRTITENFSSIPSTINFTKVPGGGTLVP